jgi:nitroreductase
VSAIDTETLLSQLRWRYATKQFDPQRATKEKLVPISWDQRQLADASHVVVFAVKHPIPPADVRHYIERTAEVRGSDAGALRASKGAIFERGNN